MSSPNEISPRQMELLVEFAESQPDIALGRLPAGPLSNQAIRLAWKSIALKLNAIGEGLSQKPYEWRKYWIEFKATTRAKAANCEWIASSTAGGPNRINPLNKIEERVLALCGGVVENLPGVSIPVEALENLSAEPRPSKSTANNPITGKWLGEGPSLLKTQPQNPIKSEPTSIISAPPQEVEALSHNPLDKGCVNMEKQQIENPQMEDIPGTSQSNNRQSRRSSRSTRTRSLRQVLRDERVPRWVYELESRHISVQQRMVHVMKEHNEINARAVGLLEEFNENFRGLCNDIRFHIGLNLI